MKLNKELKVLSDAMSKIQKRIIELEEKAEAIQEHAAEKERTLTMKEQIRYNRIYTELVNLYCENHDLQITIGAISDWCDEEVK